MHVRILRFHVDPGSQDAMTAFAAEVVPEIRQQPGLVDVRFFGDDSDGEWGLLAFWESADEAMAAASVIRPRLDARLAGRISAPPEAKLFEVYDV